MANGTISKKQQEILDYLKETIINRGFRLLYGKSAKRSI